MAAGADKSDAVQPMTWALWVRTPPNCAFCAIAEEAFGRRRLKPAKVTIADQGPVVATLVASGIGLAIMIEDEARKHRAAGRMGVWNEVVGSIDLNFVYNRKRAKEAIVRAAIESVRTVQPCESEGGRRLAKSSLLFR